MARPRRSCFRATGSRTRCTPWEDAPSALDRATSSGLPYAPICDGRAFVRNEVRGSRTSREAVAEFLRDNVAFGESLVGLIKGSFYEDAYMSSGEVVAGGDRAMSRPAPAARGSRRTR